MRKPPWRAAHSGRRNLARILQSAGFSSSRFRICSAPRNDCSLAHAHRRSSRSQWESGVGALRFGGEGGRIMNNGDKLPQDGDAGTESVDPWRSLRGKTQEFRCTMWARGRCSWPPRRTQMLGLRLARIFHQPLGKSGAEPAKKRGPNKLHSASWGLATNSLSWRWFRLGATG
jgi:hypothetical protein